MTTPDTEAPCRGRNEALTDGIVARLRLGGYCTLLGPRYSHKSHVLRDVKATLEGESDRSWTCVLIDLRDAQADGVEGLIESVGTRTAQALGLPTDTPPASPEALRAHLAQCLQSAPGDVALLLDHLEHVPLDAVRALLVALRALYNERPAQASQRLVVVIASALNLASLSIGPTSPFNVAHPFFVVDLPPDEALQLIDCHFAQGGVTACDPARRMLGDLTRGDRHLTPLLCKRCVEMAAARPDRRVEPADVQEVEEWFHRTRAASYAPLQDTIRALEEQPVHMLNLLRVIEKGGAPRRELELELDFEIDALQLTGAVRVEVSDAERRYVARNPIYERHLRKHFDRDRVTHVLCISGEWERAVEYLEAHQPTPLDQTFRAALLGVVIDALYAAPNVQRATEGLAGHVAKAFGVRDVALYLLDRSRSRLEPVSTSNHRMPQAVFALTDTTRAEVRGFLSTTYELVREAERRSVYIPLRRRRRRAFGVLVVRAYGFGPQDDEFLTLLAFSRQISLALSSVIERERQLLQLRTLEETGRRLTSSLALEDVLRTTVEAGLTAVGGAQRGVLMLWDESIQRLVVRSQTGFRPAFAEEMKLERGQGYVGQVFATGQPMRITNVPEDPRVLFRNDPDVARQKSAAVVPLVAWGRPIGALCVDNVDAFDVFHEDDEEVLAAFAAQAAVAIHNARVHRELYELGLLINRGDATPHEIFSLAVERILRISGATAASMLLLHDTHDPDRSVAQGPVLAASKGLGEDYPVRVRPRREGVTHAALRLRRPVTVSRPEDVPGLNPLAVERGVRACVCLPMTVQHTILGVLFVQFALEHTFSQNEIETLSLFANQCAMAIVTARQREALRVNAFVAWMGIEQSERAHEAAQKVAAAQYALSGMERLVAGQPQVLAKIEEARGYMRKVSELTQRVEVQTPTEPPIVDLNSLIRDELPQWCGSVPLDLDGLAHDALVQARPEQVRKVLKNLIGNAVRAAKQSPAAKVTVSTRVVGGRVEMEMHNPGRPISQAVRERVFREPVTNAQGATGSGVGLLIVRTILLAYGGDAELVRSGEDGTLFRLWLPAAPVAKGEVGRRD